MPEQRVICGDASIPIPRDALRLSLTGANQTFQLQIENIRQALATAVPDRLVDLLEIAAYVFAADRSIGRGGEKRQHWGEAWRRRMALTIPVRDLAFWQQEAVGDALSAALDFVSEDDFRFEFVQAQAPPDLQAYLPFSNNPQEVFQADEVMLFSGGTDSLAGAVETLATTEKRIVLVTHRSSPKTLRFQRDLAKELQRRYPQRVYAIQVYAARANAGDAVESTQRTRSFLYAASGFVVARMFGAKALRFWENGVVSANLAMSEQVQGTMATRTTHPNTLRLFRHLLSLVAEATVDLDNPYIWKTRADLLTSLSTHGAVDLIRRSVSCSNTYQMRNPESHCGACSQCLDRRFSILAAGLADQDPAERYAVDLLRGARTSDRDRTMAVDYTRHWVRLADVSEGELITRFGGELTRLVDGFPEADAGSVAENFHDLLRRQGQAVRQVLSEAIATASDALAAGELPDTCLLRLHVGSGDYSVVEDTQPPITADRDPAPEVRPSIAADLPTAANVLPLQIELSDETDEARIIGVTDLRGRSVDLIRILKEQHDEDLQEQRQREDHRFVHLEDLVDALGLQGQETVRQVVRRARNRVADALSAHLGEPVADDPLIETHRSYGYRLHPGIRFVKPRSD